MNRHYQNTVGAFTTEVPTYGGAVPSIKIEVRALGCYQGHAPDDVQVNVPPEALRDLRYLIDRVLAHVDA
jgi:hypothetical protein